MPKSLRSTTIRALLWSFVDASASRLLTALIAIALARLLLPQHFGLMGMLALAIALASLVVEGGLSSALIQKQEITPQDTNTVFYVNIGVGTAAAALMFFTAPWIAAFYREPALEDVTRVMSLLFILNGLTAVQTAQLTRQLRFKALAVSNVISVAVSGGIAIFMAVAGFAIWSLVVQQLSLAMVRAVCMWVQSPWRPALIFSTESFRQLSSYGWRILVAGALRQTFENFYIIVIGRTHGAVELGYYTRADLLQKIPAQSLSQVFNRVTFPVFASIQDDPQRLKRGMRKSTASLVLINFPMMVGLALTSEPLIVTLLTEKWLPAAPLLSLLSVVGLFYPLHSVNLNLLRSSRRSDLYLRISVIKQMLTFVNVAVTWRYGVQAIICGQIVLSFIAFFLNARYSHMIIGYGTWAQVKDITPYIGATAIMAAVVWGVGLWSYPSPAVELLVQAGVGVAVYVACCALFRLEAYTDAVKELRARLGKARGRQ